MSSVLEATPGRPSVLVRARGTGGGRTLLLCGHIDTVGVEGMTAPHEPRVDGDRLYGRGAYDMKAGVAAALVACREAARARAAPATWSSRPSPTRSTRASASRRRCAPSRADAAIVTEPTELELAVAHKGFVWVEIEVRGPRRARLAPAPRRRRDRQGRPDPDRARRARRGARRAHAPAARPRLGARLADRGRRRAVELPGALRRSSSSAGRCRARRRADVEARARRAARRCRAATRRSSGSGRCSCASRSRSTRGRARRDWCAAAAAEALGAPPRSAARATGPTPRSSPRPASRPCMFGPGGEGAHAAEEWVSLRDTESGARVLCRTAGVFCA